MSATQHLHPGAGWMTWSQIPVVTPDGSYGVDVGLRYLPTWPQSFAGESGAVDVCPDFQRGHIWTMDQRVAYLEAKAARAVGVDVLRWNITTCANGTEGPLQCVDGLQRFTTACMFLRDEVPLFGRRFSEIHGSPPLHMRWRCVVNDLPTRSAVLRWYLEINAGGTPHSAEELNRVRDLLQKEREV